MEHGGAAPAIIDRSADLDRLIEPLTKGGYYHAGQVCVSVQPTGDNYSDPPTGTWDAIVAFDAESGELVWSRQTTTGDAYNLACVRAARANCPQANGPDYDFASSAVMTVLPGRKRALIGAQKSGVVTAVDPDRSGEIIWQKKVGRGGRLGGVQWGVATDESTVYVAVSDLELNPVAPGFPGAQTSPFNPKVAFLLDDKLGDGLQP